MAELNWIGGTEGDEGKWDEAGNYVEEAVPESGDRVFLQRHPNGTSYSITDGLDQSAVELAGLSSAASYSGAIGSLAGPLQIDVDGQVRLEGSGPSMLAGDFAEVHVFGGANNENMVRLSGTSKTIDSLIAIGGAGRIVVTGSVTVGAMRVAGLPVMRLFVDEDAAVTDLIAMAGRVVSLGDVGSLQLRGSAVAELQGGAYTLIDLSGNAQCNHTSAGALGTIRVFGPNARFDGRANTNVGVSVTTIEAYPGGVADLRSAINGYDVETIRKLGGQVLQWADIEAAA